MEERDSNKKEDLIDYIEKLRAKKSVLMEEKGERLAAKLKTKWYNEGKKFLDFYKDHRQINLKSSLKLMVPK